MRPFLNTYAALAVLAVGLAACQDPAARRPAADNRICTPFPKAASPGTAPAADPAAPLEDCLHRWGYSLAPSIDAADQVAQATVAVCRSQLAAWNRQILNQAGPTGGASGPIEAPSLTTGQPVNQFTAHHEYAQGRALFYVVQARAGRCAPPPPETPATP
jgi:hypothetical protein